MPRIFFLHQHGSGSHDAQMMKRGGWEEEVMAENEIFCLMRAGLRSHWLHEMTLIERMAFNGKCKFDMPKTENMPLCPSLSFDGFLGSLQIFNSQRWQTWAADNHMHISPGALKKKYKSICKHYIVFQGLRMHYLEMCRKAKKNNIDPLLIPHNWIIHRKILATQIKWQEQKL